MKDAAKQSDQRETQEVHRPLLSYEDLPESVDPWRPRRRRKGWRGL